MKIKNRNRTANMKHKMKIQNANGSTLSESQTNLLLSMGAQTKVFQFPQWHWPGFNLFSSTSLLLVSDVWAQKATIKLHYSIRSGYPFDFDLRYRFRWLHCTDGKLTSALFRVTDRSAFEQVARLKVICKGKYIAFLDMYFCYVKIEPLRIEKLTDFIVLVLLLTASQKLNAHKPVEELIVQSKWYNLSILFLFFSDENSVVGLKIDDSPFVKNLSWRSQPFIGLSLQRKREKTIQSSKSLLM